MKIDVKELTALLKNNAGQSEKRLDLRFWKTLRSSLMMCQGAAVMDLLKRNSRLVEYSFFETSFKNIEIDAYGSAAIRDALIFLCLDMEVELNTRELIDKDKKKTIEEKIVRWKQC